MPDEEHGPAPRPVAMVKPTPERLLEIFEAVRETPGAAYEPGRLIHYLIENPDGNKSVHNSFKGKRYFHRFIRSIETEYGICYTNKDHEALESLERLTAQAVHLQERPQVSLTVIKFRLREKFPAGVALVALVVYSPIAAVCYRLFGMWGLVSLAVPAVFIGWLVKISREEKVYHQKLREQIERMRDGRE